MSEPSQKIPSPQPPPRSDVETWKVAYVQMRAAVEERNQQIAALMAERDRLQTKLRDAQATADRLQHQYAETRAKYLMEAMHAAGLEAQRDAYMEVHPDSPLLADSGRRFKSAARAKTVARLIYESAFDAKGHELGVPRPQERRND
ncbi:MAG: hypothetical protein ACK5YI_07990 [Rhodospirillales bacterium]|jgi:hypothetical protein